MYQYTLLNEGETMYVHLLYIYIKTVTFMNKLKSVIFIYVHDSMTLSYII